MGSAGGRKTARPPERKGFRWGGLVSFSPQACHRDSRKREGPRRSQTAGIIHFWIWKSEHSRPFSRGGNRIPRSGNLFRSMEVRPTANDDE